jgi:hypothetical protein
MIAAFCGFGQGLEVSGGEFGRHICCCHERSSALTYSNICRRTTNHVLIQEYLPLHTLTVYLMIGRPSKFVVTAFSRISIASEVPKHTQSGRVWQTKLLDVESRYCVHLDQILNHRVFGVIESYAAELIMAHLRSSNDVFTSPSVAEVASGFDRSPQVKV